MKLYQQLFAALCVLFVSSLPLTIARSATTASNKDATYLPISIPNLQKGLERNKTNAVGLVQLLRRADQQKIGDVAFDYMKRMRLREPNNAIVQAAYCFAHDFDNQETHAESRVRGRTAAEKEAFDISLERAYKLAPRLWLTYVVDANRQFYGELVSGVRATNDALALLTKAVKLAPRVSLTHYYLARGLSLFGLRGKWQSYDEAVEHLKIASTLQPALVDAPLLMLSIREIRARNQKEAKWAAQQIVKLLAVGSPVSDRTRKRLAKYGVTVPWKSVIKQ